jgi:hypothetical protein
MMDSGLQPDPPPDAYEKKLRMGCGALFGICVGLYAAAAWAGLESSWVWLLVVVAAAVFARLALVYGHGFWLVLLRIVRAMMP